MDSSPCNACMFQALFTELVKTLILPIKPSSVEVVKKQRAGRVYMIEGITQGTPLYFKLIM